jgi:hypothetical protein
MDNIFTCSKCGQPFSSNWPSSVRHRLRKNGKIFCSKSCAAITHGAWSVNDQFNSEYRSWQAMKSRCNCKGNTHYERYGGRGITYETSWGDFENFLKDMGPKESSKLELERIDNDKNYCKENCRWATHKEQTRNRGGKRATRLYTFEEKTMCIADWAKETGISPQSMQKRLNNNWPLEKAFCKERRDGKGSKQVKPR